MARTKFSAGQRVSVVRGGLGGPNGVVSIIAALPLESGRQTYRIRGDGETFERVIDEARLEAVRYD